MFKNLFKRKVEVKEIAIPCTCESNNEHCDLILQLRKCQDLRKEIKNEIEVLDNNNHELISNFICFLKTLESNGLRLNPCDKWMSRDDVDTCIIEFTIDGYSSTDIFRMTEELRTYKNKADIICEKQRALKSVEDDIKKIKSKLGIE